MNAVFVTDTLNGDVKLFLCDRDHAINICNRAEIVTTYALNTESRYRTISYCNVDTLADMLCDHMPKSIKNDVCVYIRRMYAQAIDMKIVEAVGSYKKILEIAQKLHDIPMQLRDTELYQIVYGKHDGCNKMYKWINIVTSDDKRVSVSDRITVITTDGVKDDVTVHRVEDTSVLPYPDKLSFVVCKNENTRTGE